MKNTKTTWIVKAYTGYEKGWQEIKRFDNPGDADEWLCSYVRENGYSITDFNIVRRYGGHHATEKRADARTARPAEPLLGAGA